MYGSIAQRAPRVSALLLISRMIILLARTHIELSRVSLGDICAGEPRTQNNLKYLTSVSRTLREQAMWCGAAPRTVPLTPPKSICTKY
jgi:hypothetical protein